MEDEHHGAADGNPRPAHFSCAVHHQLGAIKAQLQPHDKGG
ncbi:hypothetical protein ACVW02_002930 [Ewingella americana]